jgi:threonine dehydrogenase-like Zn-dependent dehydrogenase
MRGVWCDGSAARFRADLPEPRPGAGEVIVDVVLAGICDTDLQLARGYMGYRGVLGHEFVGTLPGGQRVTAEINAACGTCPTCAAGRPGHCPQRSVLGILKHDGAMAERVAVPARNLHLIPDAIADAAAVFIEPLAAAFQMVEQVRPRPGMELAVLGDGKLGTLCAWAARGTGATVHLVGKHPEKLALAGPGITTHLLPEAEALGRPFDVVVDATGSPTGLPAALRLVRPCGTVVLKTTIAARYEIDLAPIVIDEIRLIGSRCGPFPRAIAALAAGEIDVRPLVGAEFPLDRAEEAFRAAGTPGARKVLLRP